jgi:hypothetical protein
MSKRIDKFWVVFASIENADRDRCVDVFRRPDASFGFEAFRRDVEDGGTWTPTHYYSGARYGAAEDAYAAAEQAVDWLREVLRSDPSLRRLPQSTPPGG